MPAKAVAIGAITVIGLIGVYLWSAGDAGDVELSDDARAREAPHVAATPAHERPVSTAAVDPERAVTPDMRAPAPADPETPAEWFEGTVTDDRSGPIADVEVGFLTESEADRYRNFDAPRSDPKAIEIARTRWTLWHASDRGWMKQRAILGQVFGVDLVTRTDTDGSFRFRREAAEGRTVLAVWSPVLGFRFQAVTSLTAPARIVCERWPRIRGELTVDGELEKVVDIHVDTDRQDPPRVLKFTAEASGHYETPQIPPGKHSILFKARDHRDENKQLDLVRDVTIDMELVANPRLHARLVDATGLPWGGERLRSRGWNPDELRFILLREDFENESELARDNRPHSVLQYSPDRESLRGSVEDSQALVLSVWQGRERITAVHLPDHRVSEVTIDFPEPPPSTTLDVSVSLGKQVDPTPVISLDLGTMLGLGRYNFESATTTEGAVGWNQLEVPGSLRGQTCHLFVTAEGFAEQIVEVPIPRQGAPRALQVTMPSAEFTLVGKVVDDENQPLRGARVKIATSEGQVFRSFRESICMTDEAGEFRFSNLANGDVRLFVSHREFATTSALTPVQRNDPVTIRLRPGTERTIELGLAGDQAVMLRVLDAQGAPLMDDRVFGAVHGGRAVRLRLSIHAQTLEVHDPGGGGPTLTLDLR